MKKYLPKTWVGWLITTVLVLATTFITMLVVGLYSLYLAFAPTTTSFTSASGNQTFSVSESCFSIACDQTTTLKIRSDTAPTKRLTCDLRWRWDGIQFEDAIVEWSSDEQTIYWKFGFSSEPFNEIDIAADCQ